MAGVTSQASTRNSEHVVVHVDRMWTQDAEKVFIKILFPHKNKANTPKLHNDPPWDGPVGLMSRQALRDVTHFYVCSFKHVHIVERKLITNTPSATDKGSKSGPDFRIVTPEDRDTSLLWNCLVVPFIHQDKENELLGLDRWKTKGQSPWDPLIIIALLMLFLCYPGNSRIQMIKTICS